MSTMLRALLFISALFAAVEAVNNRPVVGILTQASGDGKTQYIAASYVKYLESAGARVVPIFFNNSASSITSLVNSLNGVLFPGGGANLSPGAPLNVAGNAVYQRAMQIFDNGGYFPVWGTCLGFELLAILTANNASVLDSGFDSENLPLPLELTPLASTSRLFAGATPEMMQWISTLDITMNNHGKGVTPQTMKSNPALNAFYDVLSNNVDRNNRPFVSTFEAKKYPIYGTQWHPEKNPFEWTTKEDLPHSREAVLMAQYMANFLVSEARKSTNNFDQSNFAGQLIYNFQPTFTEKSSSFMQKYFWPL